MQLLPQFTFFKFCFDPFLFAFRLGILTAVKNVLPLTGQKVMKALTQLNIAKI